MFTSEKKKPHSIDLQLIPTISYFLASFINHYAKLAVLLGIQGLQSNRGLCLKIKQSSYCKFLYNNSSFPSPRVVCILKNEQTFASFEMNLLYYSEFPNILWGLVTHLFSYTKKSLFMVLLFKNVVNKSRKPVWCRD